MEHMYKYEVIILIQWSGNAVYVDRNWLKIIVSLATNKFPLFPAI